MVLHKRGERLYSGLKQVLTDHLIEKVRYILVFFSAELVEMARNEFLSLNN